MLFRSTLKIADRDIVTNPDNYNAHLARGGALYLAHQSGEAIEAFNRAIEIRNNFPEAHRFKVQALLKSERYTETVKALEQLIKLTPEDRSAVRQLEHLKRYLRIVPNGKKVLPQDAAACLEVGLSLIAIENYGRAIEALNEAIRLKKDFYQAYFHKGIAFKSSGKRNQALEAFEKAVQLNDTLYGAYLEIAQIHLDSNRIGPAIKMYDQAILKNPARFEGFFEKGKNLFDQHRYGEAYVSLSGAVARNANHSGLHYLQGLTLFNLERYREAIGSFDRALVLDPDDYLAMTYKGVALERLEKTEEAIAVYDKAIALSGKAILAYQRKGRLLIEKAHDQDGINVLNQAIVLDSSVFELFVLKCWGLVAIGQYAAALEAFRLALPLMIGDPDYGLAGYAVDDGIAELKQVIKRMEAADKLLSTSTRNAQGYLDKAREFAQLKLFGKALSFAETATRLKPDLFGARLLEFSLLAKKDRFGDAVEVAKKLLRVSPGNADEKETIGEIEQGMEDLETLAAFGDAPDLHTAASYLERGKVLAKLAFHEKALVSFENAITMAPSSHKGFYEKGLLSDKMDREGEALEAFEQAIRIRKDFYPAYFAKGLNLWVSNRLWEAVEAFDSCIALEKDSADAYYWKGRALAQLPFFLAESVDAFDKVIAIKEDNRDVHYQKGLSLFRMERYKEALKAFEISESFKKGGFDLQLKKAVAWRKTGAPEAAFTAIQEALRLAPSNSEALYEKGSIYVDLEQYKAALPVFEEYITINPDSLNILLFCGRLAVEANDFLAAVKYFQGYLQRKAPAQDVEVVFGIAYSYFRLNDFSNASVYFDRAFLIATSEDAIYRKLNWLYRGQGAILGMDATKMPRLPVFDGLLAGHWFDTTIPYYLARLYAVQKNEKAALEYLEKALKGGYSDWDDLGKNIDFARLRSSAPFKELLTQYRK